MCSNLLSSAISQQQWGGLVGPASALHWGPTQEKHYLAQQIGTSSAAHGNAHHLHSWTASLVWWARRAVEGGFRHRYDDDFWTFSLNRQNLIFYCSSHHTFTVSDNNGNTLKNTQTSLSKQCGCAGLCGGSASGKTTVANKIIEALDVPWVVLLSMDSFYKVS